MSGAASHFSDSYVVGDFGQLDEVILGLLCMHEIEEVQSRTVVEVFIGEKPVKTYLDDRVPMDVQELEVLERLIEDNARVGVLSFRRLEIKKIYRNKDGTPRTVPLYLPGDLVVTLRMRDKKVMFHGDYKDGIPEEDSLYQLGQAINRSNFTRNT